MKCGGIIENGNQCNYNAKPGEIFCGVHLKKYAAFLNIFPSVIKIAPLTLKIVHPLPLRSDYFNVGGFIRIELKEIPGRMLDTIVVEINKNIKYTQDNLKNEHYNSLIIIKKDKSNPQYFIRCKISSENLIIIFIFKNSVLSTAVCILEKDFDIVKDHNFVISQHGYIKETKTEKSLHEIMYGKKAEKGGWKLIKKNDNKIIDGKNNNIDVRWITMLSGRSKDAHDPNPNEDHFYYYYDEINNCNIKVPYYNEESLWVSNEVDGKPDPNEGNPGDYYRKDENIYIKVAEHKIDHVNSEILDCRSTRLREITYKANNTNINKGEREYLGVRSTSYGWYQGYFKHENRQISKTFESQEEAARFRDYYVLALNGVEMTNNNVLSEEEMKEILLRGIDAIPKAYRIKEKELPKGITNNGGRFNVKKTYKSLEVRGSYSDLMSAEKAIEGFEEEKAKLVELEKEMKYMENLGNVDGNYGYIIISKDGIIHRFKLNLEVYKIFVHITWCLDRDDRPYGTYNNKVKSLHVHVYKYYYPNYNKNRDGTIDHRYGNISDCTIEFLRAASASLQAQNVNRNNLLGYQGIRLQGSSFVAKYKGQSDRCESLNEAILKRNERIIKDFGLDEFGKSVGKIDIIPHQIIKMKDLYGKENLSIEKLRNANVGEIKSIYCVNPDWKKNSIHQFIKKINIEECREELIDFYLKN